MIVIFRWPCSNCNSRFFLKFQKIVQEEQDTNFISRLHAGKLNIIPWYEFSVDYRVYFLMVLDKACNRVERILQAVPYTQKASRSTSKDSSNCRGISEHSENNDGEVESEHNFTVSILSNLRTIILGKWLGSNFPWAELACSDLLILTMTYRDRGCTPRTTIVSSFSKSTVMRIHGDWTGAWTT